MEFDWINPPFDVHNPLIPREIEEAFEDPFSLRLAPDEPAFTTHTRYICLGKTLDGKGVFSIYRTNGNSVRVVCSRLFAPEEDHFYERKKQMSL
jgi:uncharacterized DUF497 family protein